MAVDASDIALLDLGADARPPFAHQHPTDVPQLLFRIAVIELQHDAIRRAAIDARVCGKVLEDFTAILDATRIHLSDRPTDVVGFIRQVMGMSIRGVANPAVRIELTTALVRKGELSGRFFRAA